MITKEQGEYRALFSKIATIALLVAVVPIWPYFFYQALKLVVFGVSVFSVYLYHKEKNKKWMLTMIGIAIVFNPINPLYFGHFLWSVVDLIVAWLIYVSPKPVTQGQQLGHNTQNVSVCSGCHASVSAGTNFCKKCGTRVN